MGDSSDKNDKPGKRPARSTAGGGAEVNDKTQLLSDSQVVEVKPDDKNDRSVWKGLVVGADEFAVPAQKKSSGPSSLVLLLLAAGVLGAGGYLAWSKLRSTTPPADAAKAVAVDAGMPQDAAPVAVPSATPDAPAPDAAAEPIDAGVEDAGVDAGTDAGVDAGVRPIRRKYRPKRLLDKKKAH